MSFEVDANGRLRITRWFPVGPDRVFRAFVDPGEVARWMWAELGSSPRAEIDLEVGGRYRIAIDPPEGEPGWDGRADIAMSGVYVEIAPPHRLVYTLHWEADVGYNPPGTQTSDEVVIVDLTGERDGTSMVYQHLGIRDDGVSAVEHGKGTDAAFDVLERLLGMS